MPRYYDFDVALKGVEPRIWRRFLLPTTCTFAHLHLAIQESFGWENSHRWECRLPWPADRLLAGSPFYTGPAPPDAAPDGHIVRLNTYFVGITSLQWCEYLYDFGDQWVHDVRLMGLREIDEPFKRRLEGGARACPVEDSGGLAGYARCIEFAKTGKDDRYDERFLGDWLGDWDPDHFDFKVTKASFDR